MKERLSLSWFGESLAKLNDRGPDGNGKKVLDHGRLALGHTRLSIIDTTDQGEQPLSNEDGCIWITFNGEIYNYKALREELLECGHVFRTATDTEVIVHAYEQWGKNCVRRFRGIFAFGIWDEEKQLLFLARDHVGVKPLYYCIRDDSFTFASQPKAIISNPSFHREICDEAFRDYLAYSYIPEPMSIFRGIEKVPPGHFLEITRNDAKCTRYWEATFDPTITDFGEATEAIANAVRGSIVGQLVSDVPVGALLSGGIDSTLVTAIASQHANHEFGQFRTFTLGFDELDSDERQYAKIAAEHFQTAHYVDELTCADLPAQLEEVVQSFDEPFDSNGPLPATRIAQLVHHSGTKVVLGGDGGDELFAGYLRYDDFSQYKRRCLSCYEKVSRFLRRNGRKNDIAEYFKHEGVCTSEILVEIMPSKYSRTWLCESISSMACLYDDSLPSVTACQMIDFNHYLPGHILTKVDRATMHYGVEARVPFLDLDLVELAFRIDSDVNYQGGERKAALKSAAATYLPKALMTGRKKGFSSPMKKWSSGIFQAWAKSKIENGLLVNMDLVRTDAVETLFKRPSHKRFRAFWLLLTAELWAEKWLINDDDRLTIPRQYANHLRESNVPISS